MDLQNVHLLYCTAFFFSPLEVQKLKDMHHIPQNAHFCVLYACFFSRKVQKLKDENNLLSRKLKELDDRLFYIKRAGCGGPGCGRSAAAAAGASSTGVVGGGAGGSSAENDSSAASVSSGGSRHSMSPTRRVRGGVGEGGGGSPGKAYNLRRRGKVADEKGVRGVGAPGGGVNTRGRRTGLRDMTNAS